MRLPALFFLLVVFLMPAAQAGPIEERQANFKANNQAMRAIASLIGAGDMAGIAQNARQIASWADEMAAYFPAGSDSRGASPAIWQNFDDFKDKAAANKAAALRIAELAEAGQKAEIGAALQALGGSCKSCHFAFKN